MIRKMLLATTNEGKILAIKARFEMLHFLELVTLDQLDIEIKDPEETEDTLIGNALLKAKYYAEKTGMLVLADDTGLFVEALDGYPGVKSARIAESQDKLADALLEKMDGEKNRKAEFRCVTVVYDPITKNQFSSEGILAGELLSEKEEMKPGRIAYDCIFFHPESNKTLGQMETNEKNAISHRGKALQQIHYFLENTLGSKHIVVPIAVLIQNGKILKSLRNDPHNSEFHKKWEFPGGSVEFGENIEECVIREAKEEVGYDVEPIQMLSHIPIHSRETKTYQYQVFILPYVCKVVGGDGSYNDLETLDTKWFDIDEVASRKDLMPGSTELFKKIIPELKSIIKEHNL